MTNQRKTAALFLAGLLIASGLLVGGCANIQNGPPATRKEPSPPVNSVDNRLVSANTRFSFNLFAEILKQDAGKNIFISPASVAMALAMTYNGAAGDTQQAMGKTLELQGMSIEEVNRANAALRTVLENPDPKVELTIANSLWARKDITFKPEFMQRNKDFYGAEVVDLDFDSPNAPETINVWVNKKTNGKIDKVVESINRDAILFLINAIYFRGNWTVEFDRAKTKESTFTLLDGTQKNHLMMSQAGNYKYFRGNNFEAISLPYGEGRVNMYVFLPDRGSSLKEFYKNLNADNWDSWMSQFHKREGNIAIPRFKLEYEVELNQALKALGMRVAFDRERADFGNMCSIPPNVFIDNVSHKTFIEINEKGTEAAAVTSVMVGAQSINEEKFNMIVDRPFFFAIRDDKTATILFMGSVVEPN